MTGFLILIGIGVVALLIVVMRIVRQVETRTERSGDEVVINLGIGHTIASLFFWPAGMISFALVVFVLLPMMFLIRPRYLLPAVRSLSRLVMLSVGVIIRVEGKERFKRPKPFILMFNHQSIFDVFILGAVMFRYMTGLGAAYQFGLPLWGPLLQKWGVIPIPRKDLEEAIKSIELARQKLDEGTPVLVAPEGTRTLTGKIREFKKGPFHLALGAKVDILPMVIQGAFEIKQKTDWRLHPGVVRVRIGEFIPYQEYEGMSVEEVRDHVRGKLRKLAGEIP